MEKCADSFWSLVDRSPGPAACWLWTGHINAKGYAYVRWGLGRRAPSLGVHVLAFTLANGRAPDTGRVVRHSCDVRHCCNPTHLSLGTPAENSGDMVDRGRSITGDEHHWAVLSEQEVILIRQRLRQGERRVTIAKDFRVSPSTVGYIDRGVTWKRAG